MTIGRGGAGYPAASSRSCWRNANFWIFPDARAREVVDGPQVLGPLLPRQARGLEVPAHRLQARGVGPREEPDEAAAVLAEAHVGRGDDRDLGDAGHAQQQLLDLERADVLAAADDDVLLAVDDREVAVVVEHADVAGREPAVGVERLGGDRGIGVAGEQVGPAAVDLAGLARLDGLPVVVEEPDLDPVERAPVGVQALLAGGRRDGCR